MNHTQTRGQRRTRRPAVSRTFAYRFGAFLGRAVGVSIALGIALLFCSAVLGILAWDNTQVGP